MSLSCWNSFDYSFFIYIFHVGGNYFDPLSTNQCVKADIDKVEDNTEKTPVILDNCTHPLQMS
jgi:hypothetical protein